MVGKDAMSRVTFQTYSRKNVLSDYSNPFCWSYFYNNMLSLFQFQFSHYLYPIIVLHMSKVIDEKFFSCEIMKWIQELNSKNEFISLSSNVVYKIICISRVDLLKFWRIKTQVRYFFMKILIYIVHQKIRFDDFILVSW